MPNSPPPETVLRAFGVDRHAALAVAGGQGVTFRAGGVALKPCDDAECDQWLAAVMANAVEQGFRIARPVKSNQGSYVVDGWCAARWIAGETEIGGRWAEAIAACDAFHRALSDVPFSPVLRQPGNIYTQTRNKLADGTPPPPDERLGPMAQRLWRMLRPMTLRRQLTHGDPSEGNLLFSPGLPVGIIDMAACWQPADYAVAMLVADGIAWSGAPASLLEDVQDRPEMDQLLARAVLFRLQVGLIFGGPARAAQRAERYAPVVEAIEQWQNKQP